MSNSPHTSVPMGESLPLTTIAGSGDTCPQVVTCPEQGGASRSRDRFHRKLAIGSIICGFSCIGIKALINSVMAEATSDPEAKEKFSRRARKLGIISIVAWLSFLASIPILMALFSYLATLKD